VDEGAFPGYVSDHLAALPGVLAVTLGGSRAQGTHRADSDWDFAVYYRGQFDPQDLRDLGWPGEVFEIGGWGGGVFNGGAWLAVDGRRTDVHYRDLDTIDQVAADAREGRFRIEPLLFHLAGIPTYLILAELALHQVLSGELPRPEFPAALRAEASREWWHRADLTFGYARTSHAPSGRTAQCAGLVAQAACQAAHAVLAAGGQWVTNEKSLLMLAGLDHVHDLVAGAGRDPDSLRDMVDSAQGLCRRALQQGGHQAGSTLDGR
jgi:hypothetical protein